MWQSVVALPQPVGPSSKQITKPKLLGATSNLFLSISKEPQLLQQTCSSGCPFTHAHRNILLWLSRISSISICAPLLTSCLVHYREEPGCIFFPPFHQISTHAPPCLLFPRLSSSSSLSLSSFVRYSSPSITSGALCWFHSRILTAILDWDAQNKTERT